ncbi:MAG: LysR family transcriptional regulator [Pseudomonadota bacterium]
MTLELIRQFLHVARLGSFAAAARSLGKDPSSLSRAVAQLERELGVRLFHRTTRQLSLTAAGESCLSRYDAVTTELDAIADDLRDRDRVISGRVSISASVAFGYTCLMPHIASFREHYPEVQLDLKLTDRNIDLVAEQVDVAIRLAPSLHIDVVATRLLTTRYRVVATPAYVERHGALLSPQALSTRPALCFDLPAFRDRWRFRNAKGKETTVGITPAMTISNALALRRAALMSQGPALLADWLVRDDLEQGRLVDLLPDHEATATEFDAGAWLIYPDRTFMPRRTRATIDFFAEAIRTTHQGGA